MLSAVLVDATETVAGFTVEANGTSPDELPFFTEAWFGFVLLALWAAIPLVIGLLRFDRLDRVDL